MTYNKYLLANYARDNAKLNEQLLSGMAFAKPQAALKFFVGARISAKSLPLPANRAVVAFSFPTVQ
jgi:hypothetical protein